MKTEYTNFEVKIIEATVNKRKQITTYQLKYPRLIHAELMTHRVFSRNASSSRAIPVKKTLSQVWNNPAMPVFWGANQAGMQASAALEGWKLSAAKFIWKLSAKVACCFAWMLVKLNLHKQLANRILEPWQHIHVILTTTEDENFYSLRRHKDAQPEFKFLADMMWDAKSLYAARDVKDNEIKWANWHLPYVSVAEREQYDISECIQMSAARCARVSYLTHDGKVPSIEEDKNLFTRLVGSAPIHASPIEHQAYAASAPNKRSNNFVGWVQFRETFEADAVI